MGFPCFSPEELVELTRRRITGDLQIQSEAVNRHIEAQDAAQRRRRQESVLAGTAHARAMKEVPPPLIPSLRAFPPEAVEAARTDIINMFHKQGARVNRNIEAQDAAQRRSLQESVRAAAGHIRTADDAPPPVIPSLAAFPPEAVEAAKASIIEMLQRNGVEARDTTAPRKEQSIVVNSVVSSVHCMTLSCTA
jgi:hypothetical protein